MLKHTKSLLATALTISVLAISAGAYAMTSSSSTSSSGTVQPYSGGASISKVFHPADGSTVTITSTGAVIKQSPGHTAYREGWVSVCDMNNINSEADLSGRMASGSSNPYSSNCQSASTGTTTPTPAATTTPTNYANATANATVNLTGSTTPVAQTTATSTPTSSTSTSSSGKGLPNTGPGSVFAISGVVTILSAVGHFVFQRLRFRALA